MPDSGQDFMDDSHPSQNEDNRIEGRLENYEFTVPRATRQSPRILLTTQLINQTGGQMKA